MGGELRTQLFGNPRRSAWPRGVLGVHGPDSRACRTSRSWRMAALCGGGAWYVAREARAQAAGGRSRRRRPPPAPPARETRELALGRRAAGRPDRPRGRLPAGAAGRPRAGRRPAGAHQGRAPQAVAGARLPACRPCTSATTSSWRRTPIASASPACPSARARSAPGARARDQSGPRVRRRRRASRRAIRPSAWRPSGSSRRQREHAQTLGYTVVDASTVIATHLSQLLQRHAHELLGHEEVQQLLERAGEDARRSWSRTWCPRCCRSASSCACCRACSPSACRSATCARSSRRSPSTPAARRIPQRCSAQVRVALGRQIVQDIVGLRRRAAGDHARARPRAAAADRLSGGGRQRRRSSPGSPSGLQRGSPRPRSARKLRGEPAVLLVPPPLRSALARFMRASVPGLHVLAWNEIPGQPQGAAGHGGRLLIQGCRGDRRREDAALHSPRTCDRRCCAVRDDARSARGHPVVAARVDEGVEVTAAVDVDGRRSAVAHSTPSRTPAAAVPAAESAASERRARATVGAGSTATCGLDGAPSAARAARDAARGTRVERLHASRAAAGTRARGAVASSASPATSRSTSSSSCPPTWAQRSRAACHSRCSRAACPPHRRRHGATGHAGAGRPERRRQDDDDRASWPRAGCCAAWPTRARAGVRRRDRLGCARAAARRSGACSVRRTHAVDGPDALQRLLRRVGGHGLVLIDTAGIVTALGSDRRGAAAAAAARRGDRSRAGDVGQRAGRDAGARVAALPGRWRPRTACSPASTRPRASGRRCRCCCAHACPSPGSATGRASRTTSSAHARTRSGRARRQARWHLRAADAGPAGTPRRRSAACRHLTYAAGCRACRAARRARCR